MTDKQAELADFIKDELAAAKKEIQRMKGVLSGDGNISLRKNNEMIIMHQAFALIGVKAAGLFGDDL